MVRREVNALKANSRVTWREVAQVEALAKTEFEHVTRWSVHPARLDAAQVFTEPRRIEAVAIVERHVGSAFRRMVLAIRSVALSVIGLHSGRVQALSEYVGDGEQGFELAQSARQIELTLLGAVRLARPEHGQGVLGAEKESKRPSRPLAGQPALASVLRIRVAALGSSVATAAVAVGDAASSSSTAVSLPDRTRLNGPSICTNCP